MKLTTRVYRTMNKLLNTAGLQITPVSYNFEPRLSNGPILDRMIEDLTLNLTQWLAKQTLFDVKHTITVSQTRQFYDDYLVSDFRRIGGASQFNNLLSLYAVTMAYQPDLIIDSGTFTGASAWALKRGEPNARIVSYDIDMTRLHTRVAGVEYIERDWFKHDVDVRSYNRTFAFFDDHVDQARRLIEAHERGVELSLFDDDYSTTTFMGSAHGGIALPKIEFVLDENLRKVRELSWEGKKGRETWPVDVDYLDRARTTIGSTERLPDGSHISGVMQLPYRLVKMAA